MAGPPSVREREAWRRAELCWAMAGADRTVLAHTAGGEDEPSLPHPLVRWAADHPADVGGRGRATAAEGDAVHAARDVCRRPAVAPIEEAEER